ncbi:MAG: thioredoxin domain-containing protein, partial [Methanoregulaceae archaeon]|nr:thioredoxin domain-containing protein [Methanoregulaceae archaeon]
MEDESSGNPRANRLSGEVSPYLLQHAKNPVDWHPWGGEAFFAAKKSDKMIFLSIGYATCHWCHVMEKESFEDPEVASVLNRDYIPIKVDREERPDIDQLYMAASQALSGSGGWPLNLVLTPDRKPFFAMTYVPREGRFGRPGIIEILTGIARMWKEDREKLIASVDLVVRQIGGYPEKGKAPARSALEAGFEALLLTYDRVNGGFGLAPKFPLPHNLFFLLRYASISRDERAVTMSERTLQSMIRGGIWDHIGYGFHRYSTDSRWQVPHFEKMLY